MFDVGFSELVVIGLVALLVLGPKRLPEVARTAGRWMGQFRRFADGVRQDFQSEINAAEFNELRKIKEDLDQARDVFEGSLAPDRTAGTGTTNTPSPASTAALSLPPAPTPVTQVAVSPAAPTAPAPDATPPAALNDGRKRS